MESLNRYLQAIKFWLPKGQQDIVAELAEDIRSELEEKEAVLGRKLNETELESILKEKGSPLLVARQYMPQRYLIGPVLFPVYWLLLRGLLLYYVAPWILVWLCFVVFVPSYRIEHPGLALIGSLRGLWLVVVNSFLGLTVGFALVEKYRLKSWLARDWEPRKLAGVPDEDRISRFSSFTGLVWALFLALWWLSVIRFPEVPDLQVTPALGIRTYFYWPILLLLLTSSAIAAVNLLSPIWTRRRAAITLINESAWALVAGLLIAFRFFSGPFLQLVSPKAAPAALASFSYWVNFACLVAVVLIAISSLVKCIQDLHRLRAQRTYRNWMTDMLGGH